MASLIGIVFDVSTKEVRRIINPDWDSQLDDPTYLLDGEAMLKVSKESYEASPHGKLGHQTVVQIIEDASKELMGR